MDIVFKGRHTDVLERFRTHATGKLAKVEKLDHKVIRIDVEVTTEHNPRQADRKERVELTITTRGPAIRAEAAAEDRFGALDLALAKLESRLRRAGERRKDRHAVPPSGLPELAEVPSAEESSAEAPVAEAPVAEALPAQSAGGRLAGGIAARTVPMSRPAADAVHPNGSANGAAAGVIAIETQGQEPLVVREKFHRSCPMTIDQALFEMELVGHDFFLFTDVSAGLPSVVYRRRGYQYGVIRLAEEEAAAPVAERGARPAGLANGQPRAAANLANG